jgi:hypothetical protein
MTARKARGRPASIWRGPIGYKFVEQVALAKYHHRQSITTGRAIRMVLREPEFAPLRKYAKNGSTRYLQKQLIDAAEFWGIRPSVRELIGRGSPIWNQKTIIGTPSRDRTAAAVAICFLLSRIGNK